MMLPHYEKRSGFTLMEMLVVLAIIGVLVSVVGVGTYKHLQDSKVRGTLLNMKNLETGVTGYLVDNDDIPSMRQGLQALVSESSIAPVPKKFPKGGYLSRAYIPLDEWGHEFVYVVPGRDGQPYELISYGRDGEPGGLDFDADLSNLDRR